jgi:hypothetical protein
VDRDLDHAGRHGAGPCGGLASQNSDLSSMTFDEKKAMYALSPMVLTKQIADLDEWTEDAIDARQEQLAQLAIKAWPTN